jgi:hypothetical protein
MKYTSDIPTITIEIEGNSIPEDANYFYFPFIEMLENLAKTDLNFVFNFKLHHYNTMSTRYITAILKLLKPLAAKKRVIINWYYIGTYGDNRNYDEHIAELGQDYKETLKIKMNILERKL